MQNAQEPKNAMYEKFVFPHDTNSRVVVVLSFFMGMFIGGIGVFLGFILGMLWS